MHHNPTARPARLLLALTIAGGMALGSAAHAQDHSAHGGGDGGAAADAGQGHDGHDQKGKKGKKGKHGKHGKQPGAVMQMCHEPGDKPPHYCEPSYKVVSSVRGVRITDVTPMGDQGLMVTLGAAGGAHHTVSGRIAVVGGTGDLAGATLVEGGWAGETVAHLSLQGDGTLWSQGKVHLHLFPYTGH